MMTRSIQHLSNINQYDEWGTPTGLYRKALFDFDIIPEIDVAAREDFRRCESYFDKKTNGLKQEWDKPWFCNPPYSNVKAWVKKATEEFEKYKAPGLLLTFAKTDTKFFHNYLYKKKNIRLEFIQGRIKFLDSKNNPSKYPAPYGSLWAIFA